MAEKRPRLVRHMEQEGVDLTLITFNWFLSIYVDCVPPEVLARRNARMQVAAPAHTPDGTGERDVWQTFYRIWDCFMYEGSKVLFRFAMGILRMNEDQILQRTGTGPLFQFLRNMTSRLYNVNELAKVGLSCQARGEGVGGAGGRGAGAGAGAGAGGLGRSQGWDNRRGLRRGPGRVLKREAGPKAGGGS